ncbi:glycosyltransferase family 4 protein [Arcticibacterium luteifluviistationis]|uniref:Glycosyltransferase family 1 protein n=1 Tax=Arcticibacterium luteifluviistationis TaxID=1784714 RepID=A0A2Z4GF49_9BACT|nr:glycosyltransferase family 4 protein [Arcticibacterium luteifluviistationis]AWV99850.1 glycosyltransferase family 1 protein [Arcticibacterium luteifluviistationis]
MNRLLIVVNVDWFFLSHRLGIAKKAKAAGFDVFIACEDTGRAQEIEKNGLKFMPLNFSRSGTHLWEELGVLRQMYNLYREVKPDIVHHVTLKPVIYGSMVAKGLKVKGVVNAIAGLGYNFTGQRRGLLFYILTNLMRFGMNRENLAVIFQNKRDFNELNELNIIKSKNLVFFTKGSGVNLEKFSFSLQPEHSIINILFPTRMLWDKGVQELHDASMILKEEYYGEIKFTLAGLADDGNKVGVPAEFLEKWSDGLYVEWVGYTQNMLELYANSNIVVLPSYYREGMPKSLLEACSVGRPIITTNSVGCEECVDDGVNGYKIPPRDSRSLANALKRLIDDRSMRNEMGVQSRKKAEMEFSEQTVIDKHMEIYGKLIDK